MISNLLIFLGSIFWPLGLSVTNNTQELLINILPTIILLFSFWLYKKKNNLFLLPLIFIPLINIKLTLFPILATAGFLLTKLKITNRLMIIFLITSLTIFVINIKPFSQQSIFKLEYEAKQEILREINLYPNIFMARLFQNKARIMTDKFSNNLLALIDPGNYFFSFHPREGVFVNQNLVKYPFLAIIPMLLGLLEINKLKQQRFILVTLIAGVLTLSFLEIFDGIDFILWLPLTIILIHGITIIYKSKNKILLRIFLVLFILNSLIELTRISYIY